MIEKMKKLTFLVYHREYEDFLHRLQDLGVMHVVTSEVDPQQSTAISGYVDQIRQCTTLQKEMNGLLDAAKLKADKTEGDAEKGLALVGELLPRIERLADMHRQKTEQENQLSQLEPWGNFDPAQVKKTMEAAGCDMQFYVVPTKVFKKQILDSYPVMEVSQKKGNTYFVLVAKGEVPELPATRITLPDTAQSKLQLEHTTLTENLQNSAVKKKCFRG